MSEIITLPALGSLPGIPGEHAPGVYEVDWEARTLTPVVPPPADLTAEVARLQEEVQSLEQEKQG